MTAIKVKEKQCSTCIYFKHLPWDIKNLEAQIADPNMKGFFKGFRVCHSVSGKVCCRGFWNRHKDKFTLGQLAQRFGLVSFVRGRAKR